VRHEPENIVGRIIRFVADYYGYQVRDVLSPEKAAPLVRIRYTIVYIIRRCSDASFPNIGRRMGGRDHSTILHNQGLAAKRVEEDPAYAAEVAAVEKMVLGKLGR
jgi:chromosomal replication initiator protein